MLIILLIPFQVFLMFFSAIAEKLLPKHTAGTKHFSEYLSDRVDQNFIFESADPVEVINIGVENQAPF